MKNKTKKTVVDYLKRNRVEDRLMAYRLLEKEYNKIAKQKNNKDSIHFCLYLKKYFVPALYPSFPSNIYLSVMDLIEKKLPELFSLRPNQLFCVGETETAYWFAPSDAVSRAELLKKAQAICSERIKEFRKNQLLNKKQI